MWNDCGDGPTWKLRDSRSGDEAAQQQSGFGAFKRCSLVASDERENGSRTLAPVHLGDVVPTSKDVGELPSVEDTIDVAREEKKRTCCRSIKE